MVHNRQDEPQRTEQRKLVGDRRISTSITPPPYETKEGRVLVDRRSSIDRRATWIREFSLESLSIQGSEAPDSES